MKTAPINFSMSVCVPACNNGKGFAINMLLGSLLKFVGALPFRLKLDKRDE
jgi:hypothetical protein